MTRERLARSIADTFSQVPSPRCTFLNNKQRGLGFHIGVVVCLRMLPRQVYFSYYGKAGGNRHIKSFDDVILTPPLHTPLTNNATRTRHPTMISPDTKRTLDCDPHESAVASQVYSMDVKYPLMVVGCAERHVVVYNLANFQQSQQPYKTGTMHAHHDCSIAPLSSSCIGIA